MDAENAPIVDKQNMRSRAVTDEEYLKQLDEMPDEQVDSQNDKSVPTTLSEV